MPRRSAALTTTLAVVLIAFMIISAAPAAPTNAAAPEGQGAVLLEASTLRAFKLVTPQEGWALLGDQLYATRTGGKSWQEITPPHLGQRSLLAVHFLNYQRGWVLVTEAGEASEPSYALARTDDGGGTWDELPLSLFAPGDLDANAAAAHLYFLDSSVGWLVFRRATGPNFDVGALFRTTDGGVTWARLPIPIGDAVYFASPDLGWVAGGAAGDELHRTKDGGAMWEQQDVPGSAVPGRRAYALPKFDNAQQGQLLVVITDGESSRLALFKTDDGGDAWQLAQEAPLDEALPTGAPLPLSLIDASQWSVVVPADGRMLGSGRGGGVADTQSYDHLSTGIVALDMATAQTGWARYAAGSCSPDAEELRCTQETRLLRTEDGGRTWASLVLPAGEQQLTTAMTMPYGEATVAGADLTQPILGQAFDSCTLPSVSQMRNWYVSSPYRTWNLYIGGSSRANCGTLTAAHIAQLAQQGWRLIPTWVGPQAACTSFSTRMSSDPAIAYAQGVSEANAATAVAFNLGLTRPDGTGTMIYYDLEAYDAADQPCRDAAKSFIAGWSAQLRARGHKAGVYGSACSSALVDFSTVPVVPDGVWIAAWIRPYEYRPEATVWNVACLANSLWNTQQRLRQYSGGHDETWGGLTLNIDSNVLEGIVAALNPPHAPTNPEPADGAITPRSLVLRWSGGDPDSGDTVNYRVYLENNANPIALVCEGGVTTCSLPNLPPNTDYYWRVVATDHRGMVSNGPVWHFRTAAVANDELENALAINMLPYGNVQETSAATVAPDDPLLSCVTARKYDTVWYRYTPASDITLEVSTSGSSYDTVLGVWTGARGALESVACNDDPEPGQSGARLRFKALAGTSYLIEAASYTTSGGTLHLSVAETAATPTISIEPPGRSITAGQAFTVGVQIADVENLGSYQLTVAYEPALLRVEAVTFGSFLGSTGRPVTPRPPVIDNSAGRATFGAYTTGVAPAGPYGTGTLAYVRLRGLARGTGHLHLEGAQTADVTGKSISPGLRDGAILVVPCEGDFDGDGQVDAEDVQRVAYRWNTICGQATYDGFYDLDGNCRIEIADVQRIAGRWGERCAGPTGSVATEPAAAATVITVQLASQIAGLGQTFTVQIQATGATNLGAMEFALGYDAERLQVVEVSPGSLLASTGRSLTAVGPVNDGKAGIVAYGLYSVGDDLPGPDGNGPLAQVTFRARQVGYSPLVLQRAQVTDVSGASASLLVQGGGVTVAETKVSVWLPAIVSGEP